MKSFLNTRKIRLERAKKMIDYVEGQYWFNSDDSGYVAIKYEDLLRALNTAAGCETT